MVEVASRRAQVRAATVADIKSAARRLLVDGGAGAISLRAVARELGLSAPALYRYFGSLEELVTTLIVDLYDELTVAITAARDAVPEDDLSGRLYAVAREMRAWAIGRRMCSWRGSMQFPPTWSMLSPARAISSGGRCRRCGSGVEWSALTSLLLCRLEVAGCHRLRLRAKREQPETCVSRIGYSMVQSVTAAASLM